MTIKIQLNFRIKIIQQFFSVQQAIYFHNFLIDIFLSESLVITLPTAISKSSCVTCMRRSRNANIPASVQTACKIFKLKNFIL